MSAIADYLDKIRKQLATGDATENSYRIALSDLLQASGKGITATNEPRHIPLIGAPDYKISRGKVPLGHVETKDVGTDLAEMEKGKGPNAEQFSRYRSLPNWILTDYLEFRWYVHGERRRVVRIAELDSQGKVQALPDSEPELTDLLTAFVREPALTVRTPAELADSMAGYTRTLRQQSIAALQQESESGWLHQWLAAFRQVLIPDLDHTVFADMFAQTLAYGLFAARVNAIRHSPNKDFTLEMAAFNTPKTNPFLHKLFKEIAGDLPDTIRWTVDDIVDLLHHANMPEILKDFGKGKGKDDPVVHFYETFLAAYDPKLRELRGVFYTPVPVVSYIVRSIDHLLKTQFAKPAGLADEKTLILDPATGTATFLYEVIRRICEKRFRNQPGAWNRYVPEKLLPRIFGFELLMAPYAIAHMKLAMLLEDTGYKFEADQRLGVYLTNTLEEAIHRSDQLVGKWLSDEANQAASIKQSRILVVLGNPPYSGVSANRGEWITHLLEVYRQINGEPLSEKKVWLKNDYVKFIRFGQWRIEQTGHGILAFITDHSYLDSPTFRGMRHHLQKTFDEIYILNLHGNAKRREAAPGGGVDENVFDIMQGAAIAIFVKHPKPAEEPVVHYADLWGAREGKYATLLESDIATTKWKMLHPAEPFYEFVPVKQGARAEYQAGWSVKDIFVLGSNGVQTSRDNLVVALTRKELANRYDWILDEETDDAQIRSKYAVEDHDFWHLKEARLAVRKEGVWENYLQSYLYRPFDVQWIFASPNFVHRLRLEVMHHLQKPNLALCIGRAGLVASGSWDLVFCADRVCDHNLFYRGSSLNFPLYLHEPETPKKGGWSKAVTLALFETPASYLGRRANLAPDFVKELTARLKLTWQPVGHGDGKKTVGPEDVFHYAYAVFHSPTYRQRYAEFLRTDFPRLPLTSNVKLFCALAAKGAEMVGLHLLETPKLNDLKPLFCGKGNNTIEKVQYTDADQRVWVNASQYFDAVPRNVWGFHVGGYQPCQKWLKDRKDRALSYDDMRHYRKIVVAQSETIRLMAETDTLLPSWPIR
jgi:hypothetical protein